MSNNMTRINGEEITQLANSLKSKGENLLNEYKNNCSQALQLSSECLQISGLNPGEFIQSLEKIYQQLNERIAQFSDFLVNVVVAEYNMVNEAVTNNFNGKFASEMSAILGVPITSSISSTPSTYPGTPEPPEPEPPSPDLTQDPTPEVNKPTPTIKPDLPDLPTPPPIKTNPNPIATPVYFDESNSTGLNGPSLSNIISPTIAAPAPTSPNLSGGGTNITTPGFKVGGRNFSAVTMDHI